MSSDEDNTTQEPQEEAAQAGHSAPSQESEEQKLKEQMLYLQAEFENSKRRLLREQENAIRFANEKVFAGLLGIVDLFDRAIGSGASLAEKGGDEFKNFFTGIEMTHRELVQFLLKSGVELKGEVGEKFDPALHEAISQSPVANEQVDTVVAVVQRGCLFQGRLLKPAKVVVGVEKPD